MTKEKTRSRITTITTTEALAEFCARAADCDYVTVDTEFLRERSYYSKLCLVQLALPTRCLLYTSPSPRDQSGSRMPSSA